MSINEQKLNEFLGRAVVDIGATLHAGLVVDRSVVVPAVLPDRVVGAAHRRANRVRQDA